MRAMVYTDMDMYLDCRIDRRQLIRMLILERIKSLIIEYGIYLQFKISKVKHKFDERDYAKYHEIYLTRTGLVKCCWKSEEEQLYSEYEVWNYLEDNWYDYAIDFEVLKEEKENESNINGI